MRNEMPSNARSARGPLLSLEEATAEWCVGVSPTCRATVRFLDDVHFEVRPGECVLVHHTDPAGVRVFLAALAGQAAVVNRHLVRGRRVVHPGVRIRRGSIRVDLVPPLVEAWSREAPGRHANGPTTRSATPVVHLLRASRAANSLSTDHAAWMAWAAAQRDANGALVIVSDERPGHRTALLSSTPPASAGHAWRGRRPATIHERAPHAVLREARVRSCELRHGRLEVVHAADTQYCWPSDSPLVVGP